MFSTPSADGVAVPAAVPPARWWIIGGALGALAFAQAAADGLNLRPSFSDLSRSVDSGRFDMGPTPDRTDEFSMERPAPPRADRLDPNTPGPTDLTASPEQLIPPGRLSDRRTLFSW